MEAVKEFFGLFFALSKSYILCRFFSCSLILDLILMEMRLKNRVIHENLDLSRFFKSDKTIIPFCFPIQ